jgi:hypothetical protein
VYDYLHGVNLREYVTDRAGLTAGARRLNAAATLVTLAGVLRALHHPQETGATPVLHMDVKPSNVMVLATGEVKLIDFTGARYWRPEEITQIAYTPESGGPEAFGGVSQLGPAYDVHGFGAVAYFLVTGEYPREPGGSRQHPPGEESPPTWSVLRRHQMLEQLPDLRDHLHQILADRPGDRPSTLELPAWVERLADLVRQSRTSDVGVEWGEPETARIIGRAKPRPPVAGTETDAFQRIEKLERELVELRAALAAPDDLRTRVAAPAVAANGSAAGSSAGPGSPAAFEPTRLATGGRSDALEGPTGEQQRVSAVQPTSVAPVSPAPATAPLSPVTSPQIRGRASVPPPRRVDPTESVLGPEQERTDWPERPREEPGILKRGWELSGIGGFFAFICWGIWAASARGQLAGPLLAFGLVLVVAAGVFIVVRLLGRLVLVNRLGRVRRSARGAHAVTGVFLVAAGVAYLQQTPWVVSVYRWMSGTP